MVTFKPAHIIGPDSSYQYLGTGSWSSYDDRAGNPYDAYIHKPTGSFYVAIGSVNLVTLDSRNHEFQDWFRRTFRAKDEYEANMMLDVD